jgi:hypothetical protein
VSLPIKLKRNIIRKNISKKKENHKKTKIKNEICFIIWELMWHIPEKLGYDQTVEVPKERGKCNACMLRQMSS